METFGNVSYNLFSCALLTYLLTALKFIPFGFGGQSLKLIAGCWCQNLQLVHSLETPQGTFHRKTNGFSVSCVSKLQEVEFLNCMYVWKREREIDKKLSHEAFSTSP